MAERLHLIHRVLQHPSTCLGDEKFAVSARYAQAPLSRLEAIPIVSCGGKRENTPLATTHLAAHIRRRTFDTSQKMAAEDNCCSWLLHETPMDVAFGAEDRMVAAGLVDGSVWVRHLQSKEREPKDGRELEISGGFQIDDAHEDSCRSVLFLDAAESLVSGSADCSLRISDRNTGKEKRSIKDAHEAGIGKLARVDVHTFVSGDDDGLIKVWDIRQKEQVNQLEGHTDFISDFLWVRNPKRLLSTSGDGTLGVYELRKGKEMARSENQEDELLSVALMKEGKKVLCGTQSGMINMFSWGYFKDMNDRLAGHPESVDALIKFDEDTILTGSSDGIIRIVQVLPNKILGVIGEHIDYPIERLGITSDRMVLASTSHDKSVKLWDISFLHEDEGTGSEEEEEENKPEATTPVQAEDSDSEGEGGKRRKKRKGKDAGDKKGKASVDPGFFDDL